jgi:hypothetical protein
MRAAYFMVFYCRVKSSGGRRDVRIRELPPEFLAAAKSERRIHAAGEECPVPLPSRMRDGVPGAVTQDTPGRDYFPAEDRAHLRKVLS